MNKFYDNKNRANMSILTKLYNIYNKQQTKIKSNVFFFWKFRTTNPNIPLILKEYNNNDYINIYTKNSNANEDNNNLYLHTNNSYNSTPALFNHKQLQLQQQQQQRCLIDSNGTNSSSRIESFLQRQENFISAKNKRLENRMKLSEKKLNALYTFSPHLSSYIKHNYSDSIKPKNNNNNNKLNEDLLSSHNPKINKKIYEYIYKNNNPKQKVKQIDKHQIEKLYNDYHQRQSRRRLLIEKIDNDNGITFKPRINTSPSYFKKQDTFNTDIPITTNKTQRNIMTYDYYKEMELMELRHNSLSKYIEYTHSK